MATQSSEALPSVGAVALKLPPFWPESAEVWFAQAEAQFNIKGISSSTTKFYHCVASMSQEVASQMLDLIRAPPASETYKVLKAQLVKTYGLNDYQRFKSLISLPLSGDQKPSHLMNRMIALLPEDFKPGFIFRGLFLRCLPADVRAHLLRKIYPTLVLFVCRQMNCTTALPPLQLMFCPLKKLWSLR